MGRDPIAEDGARSRVGHHGVRVFHGSERVEETEQMKQGEHSSGTPLLLIPEERFDRCATSPHALIPEVMSPLNVDLTD